MLDSPATPQLKWLAQIRSEGVIIGGPAIWPIEKEKNLEDIFKITILPRDFPFATDIELGILNGEAMKLKVE